MVSIPKLGVNIDHVATIREARKTVYPDPIAAAMIVELAGADGIVVHLREDRRHIQDRDLKLLRQVVQTKLNLEMATTEEIIKIALEVAPDKVTLVPEKRHEITTEGGLNVVKNMKLTSKAIKRLNNGGIPVSLFIESDPDQVKCSLDVGASEVEFHTGRYAETKAEKEQQAELERIIKGVQLAKEIGLQTHAGHGLNYTNVIPIAKIEGIEELNIGHSIVSRAVLVGLDRAVREMSELIHKT